MATPEDMNKDALNMSGTSGDTEWETMPTSQMGNAGGNHSADVSPITTLQSMVVNVMGKVEFYLNGVKTQSSAEPTQKLLGDGNTVHSAVPTGTPTTTTGGAGGGGGYTGGGQTTTPPPPHQPHQPPPPHANNLITTIAFHVWEQLLRAILNLTTKLDSMALQIRKELGTSYGEALGRAGERMFTGVTSTIGALFTGKPLLRTKELEETGAGFKKEYGGPLKSGLENRITTEAKTRNLSGEDVAKASKGFLAISTSLEMARQKVYAASAAFNKMGLSSDEAAKFAAENSELIARAGNGASSELFKMAAQAKQAGFNLATIQDFGDKTALDFGGFLDKANDLAALGVNLDVAAIGKASLSKNPEDMANAIRTSVPNIDNLSRVQQTQLANTLGMKFDELMRLVKGSSLQKSVAGDVDTEMVKNVTAVGNKLEAGMTILKTFLSTVLLAAISANTFAIWANTAASAKGSLLAGRVASVAARAGRRALIGGGAVIVGTGVSILGDHLKETGHEKLGAAASVGGAALQGAGMGFMIGGPWGAAIGAAIGAIYGIVTNFTAVKKIVKEGFDLFIKGVKIAGKLFMDFTPMGLMLKAGKGILNMFSSKPKTMETPSGEVSTKPGYGARSLVTPESITQLNNKDKVVAHTADDLIADETGITTFDRDTLQPTVANQIAQKEFKLDTSALEHKIDSLKSAILAHTGPATVYLDGRKVGTAIRDTLHRTDMMAVTKNFKVG